MTVATAGTGVQQTSSNTAAGELTEVTNTVQQGNISGEVSVVSAGPNVSVSAVQGIESVEPATFVGPNVVTESNATAEPNITATENGVRIRVAQHYIVGGEVSGWQGAAPESIAGTRNPTLALEGGELYAITWANLDGVPHNIVITNESGGTVAETPTTSENGAAQTLVFRVPEMAGTYYCVVHPVGMRAELQTDQSGQNETGNDTAGQTTTTPSVENQTNVTPPETVNDDETQTETSNATITTTEADAADTTTTTEQPTQTATETETAQQTTIENQTNVTPPDVVDENETETDTNATATPGQNTTASDLQARSIHMENVSLSNVTVDLNRTQNESLTIGINQSDAELGILTEAVTAAINESMEEFDPGDTSFNSVRSATITINGSQATVNAELGAVTMEHITAEQVTFDGSRTDLLSQFTGDQITAESITANELLIETYASQPVADDAGTTTTNETVTTTQNETTTPNQTTMETQTTTENATTTQPA